jgi:hypothetical protein
MNIVQAFIKYNKQCIILISGMSGSGISHLGKQMIDDLTKNKTDFAFVSYKDFVDKKYDKTEKIKTKDGEEHDVVIWDSDKVVDWDSFFQEINKHKKTGVIAVSQSFPTDKINNIFRPDFHFHIKLSKENLLKQRIKNSEMDKELLEQIIENYTFPFYTNSTKREVSNINKFINANSFIADDKNYYNNVGDVLWDAIMENITTWLDRHMNKSGNTSLGKKGKEMGETKGEKSGETINWDKTKHITKNNTSDEDLQSSSYDTLTDSSDVDI